jgi:hypothetical protein
MNEKTRQKIIRRLDHLRGVLSDCDGEDPNNWELLALFLTVRDIQPGLCEALSEQTGLENWLKAYEEPIVSDEEQIKAGTFLWPEELEVK